MTDVDTRASCRPSRAESLQSRSLLEEIFLCATMLPTDTVPSMITPVTGIAMRRLFRLQTVSRNFANAIEGSWKLQQLMYLLPQTPQLNLAPENYRKLNPFLQVSAFRLREVCLRFQGAVQWYNSFEPRCSITCLARSTGPTQDTSPASSKETLLTTSQHTCHIFIDVHDARNGQGLTVSHFQSLRHVVQTLMDLYEGVMIGSGYSSKDGNTILKRQRFSLTARARFVWEPVL